MMLVDSPGLASTDFEPTGRFGIGFFSVFMLGQRVTVISRLWSASLDDTWILQFGEGLGARPVLRRANENEKLMTPGTVIQVTCDAENVESGELCIPIITDSSIHNPSFRTTNLPGAVQFLVPASDCDIFVNSGEGEALAVGANDWLEISGPSLLRRVVGASASDGDDGVSLRLEEACERLGNRLSPMVDESGAVVARLAILGEEEVSSIGWAGRDYSVVTAGIARSSTQISGLAGLALGYPTRAVRDHATPILDHGLLAPWAQSTLDNLASGPSNVGGDFIRELSGVAWEMGADASRLRCFNTGAGWLSWVELVEHVRTLDQVRVVHPLYESARMGMNERLVDLDLDVVVFEEGRRALLSSRTRDTYGGWFIDEVFDSRGVNDQFTRALAEAWGLDLNSAIALFDHASRDETESQVGTLSGEPFLGSSKRIVRPSV
jgi:hypothetical protein